LLNHSLAKSASFLLAGRILGRYHSTDVEQVSGLMRTMPGTGALFAAGLLALMGLPPFGLFVSEFLLFRAGFTSGHVVATSAALVLAGIGVVGLANHLTRMLYGAAPADVATGERDWWVLVSVAVSVLVLVALGLVLPGAVGRLLGGIVEAMTV
jgi:hydrogenase-4 component F